MQKTDNYELNLPEAEDFFNVEDFNDNTKKIDEVLESLENPEHDTGKQAEVEELASGESLKVALRKLAKAVSDYISHKADQVAHITAAERTAWNAKLGTEKIAANLTTTEAGMLLDATMGKQLAETDASLQEQISTLNSNKVFTKSATQKLGEITSLADADQFAGKTGIVYLNFAGNYCEILCICLLNTTLQFRQAVFANKLYIRSSYKDASTLSTLWTDWKELI